MDLVYPPQNLHTYCFQFLLGITVVPREIEDNGYAKFWGVNKVHYGLSEVVNAGGSPCNIINRKEINKLLFN